MEINCEELGGSYAPWVSDCRKVEWGFGNLGDVFGEDDDSLNPMSFSVYQMPYGTMNSVGSGNGSGSGSVSVAGHTTLFNDFVGFGGDDVISILPEDPFCMNIRSTLNTFSDWFHENHIGLLSESYDGSFAGFDQSVLQQQISSLRLQMNDTEGFCQEVCLPEDPFCMQVSSTLNTMSNWFHENRKDFVAEQIGVVDQMLFESLSWFYNPTSISQQNHRSTDLDDDAGEPHDAFELVLPYLQLKEILAVEGVCRSLRDLVRKDPFFWRTIDLNDSLIKHRVTDESLFKLTVRSQGNLQCLNLGGCVGITDYGLKEVLSSNPHLTKLSVSGCLRLSTAGLMSTLRDLKSSNRLGLKSLITGGVLYFTKDQFEELNLLLGADAKAGPKSRKQRLYISCRSEFNLEDDQVTDLEICPRCEKPSLVFDCPAKTCSLKVHLYPKSLCRGCVVCIERCHECGKCLNDSENKPFCFAFSCVICYKKSSSHLQDII